MEAKKFGGQELRILLSEMTDGISSTREVIASIRRSQNLDIKEGISLLSLKHYIALSYLHSLVLLSTRRTLGSPPDVRSPPLETFSSMNRSPRGSNIGDAIDNLIEGRVVLEKIKILEARMRYQIEKLVRIADEPEKSLDVFDDPLAFRPNPQNLNVGENENSGDEHDHQPHTNTDLRHTTKDEVYRPPRIAPVPYREKSKSQIKKQRPSVPFALDTLISDPSQPHTESTSGLGATPSLVTGRAAYLKRLTEFEEDNFSRVMMKKSDAKKRARDEEDLALGSGLGGSKGQSHRRAGGLEDEFAEVLKSVERVSNTKASGMKGDGYEELRNKGKKAAFLERSHKDNNINGSEVEERARKRSRFELEAKIAKKRLNKGKPF